VGQLSVLSLFPFLHGARRKLTLTGTLGISVDFLRGLAAKEKDGAAVIEHLKAAGKWTLDVATDIGTKVAALAIIVALGLP
jgi:hypothetical protein